MTVWLYGHLVPTSEARVDPDDRGLLLGDGLFETMLSLGGRPVEFDAHWARLAASAAALGIPLPFRQGEVRESTTALLASNGLDSASPTLIDKILRHLREKGRDA